jgi:hypothetical protein
VYVGAGPDDLSLDAYRLSGSLANAQRLTYSPVGLGLDGLAANRASVVVNRTCCGGMDFIEKLNLSRRGGLPGTVLGPGTDPAVSPAGRLARVVSGYQGCRCDAVLVRPGLLGPDQVAFREPHPGTVVSDVWSPSGQLALLVGTMSATGTLNQPQILIDPGTPRERRIDPGSSIVLGSGIWFGPHDELSYQVNGRVVIQPPSGGPRSFLLNTWNATCWLPNGTIFTVSFLNNALGTLNPSTGAIRTVGHFGHSDLFVLDCPASPTQPVG